MSDAPASGGPSGFIRPFVITGGRTQAARPDLQFETMVRTTVAGRDGASLTYERRHIAELCKEAQSVAEVSAKLAIPLGVAIVLVGDLVASGHLSAGRTVDRADAALLERVLAGVKAL